MTTIEKVESLLTYVKENPGQRFWQALRNWAGVNFIYMSSELCDKCRDTFYLR